MVKLGQAAEDLLKRLYEHCDRDITVLKELLSGTPRYIFTTVKLSGPEYRANGTYYNALQNFKKSFMVEGVLEQRVVEYCNENNPPAAAPDTAGDQAPPATVPSSNESEVAVAGGAPTAAAAGDDAAGDDAAGLANPVFLTPDRRPGGNDYLTPSSLGLQMVRNDERYNQKILDLAGQCFGAINQLNEKVDDNHRRYNQRMDNMQGSVGELREDVDNIQGSVGELREDSKECNRRIDDLVQRALFLEKRCGNGDLDAKVKGTASQKKSEKQVVSFTNRHEYFSIPARDSAKKPAAKKKCGQSTPPVTRSSTSRAKESTPVRRTGRTSARSNGK